MAAVAALQDGQGDFEAREPDSGPHKQSLLLLKLLEERSSPSPPCVSELRPSCRALIAASLSAIPAGSSAAGFGSRRVWFGQVWVQQPMPSVNGARRGKDGEKAGGREKNLPADRQRQDHAVNIVPFVLAV